MYDSPDATSMSGALRHAWTSAMWPVGILLADENGLASQGEGVRRVTGEGIARNQHRRRVGWRFSVPVLRTILLQRRHGKTPA